MAYTAQLTDAARTYRERMLPGCEPDLLSTDPEFAERFINFAFGEIIEGTPELDDRTRFMCWIATLLGCQGVDEFRVIAPAALNMGLEAVALREIVYQATDYLGIGRVYPFFKAMNEAFEAAGIELPLPEQATTEPTDESRRAGGTEAQCAAFGENMRGFYDSGTNGRELMNHWLVKNCFGDFYTRKGLTMAERELITFCFIAAQGGCEAQLRAHTGGNVHCGRTRKFMIDVVSSNLPFIGYPRTLNALAVVTEVMPEE